MLASLASRAANLHYRPAASIVIRFYQGSGSGEIQILDDVFSLGDWQLLKAKTAEYLRIIGDPQAARFLESRDFEFKRGTNNFGDEFCVLFQMLPMQQYAEALTQKEDWQVEENARAVAAALQTVASEHVRFVAVDLDKSLGPTSVPSPVLKITSATVERALNDAERLVATEGPTSAVDRVHAALHGYLRTLADQASIAYADGASITEMFKLVRTQHPMLSSTATGQSSIDKILKAHANIVDALNPLRNHASVAHPNDELLEEPEAMLVINSVRSLLHYLNARTGVRK
ncbi:abortive infection family protein [Roseateles sp.]|uniref:abortive infection family protein n=1 Tax=Roseateles sp. TaxID=1971397 RepID=UPI0031D3D8ED